MRKIYNERHMEIEEYATTLDVLRELDKRTELNEEFIKELEHLEAKEKGINKVLKLINYYAKAHWLYMTDLALDYYGTVTCDLLLVTSAGIYLFEINDYEGTFTVKNNQCSIDDRKLNYNPIEDAHKMTSQLSNIAPTYFSTLNIQGAAIFPGLNNEVIVSDDVKEVQIVISDQLDNYFKKIVKKDKEHQNCPKITPEHLNWFEQIDYHFPINQTQVSAEADKQLRKGILCCHCGNFNVNIDVPYISCGCGMHEPLEKAIVRTICEYGVLNNDKLLEVSSLLDFFDYQISEDTLYKYLDKHFTPMV